MKSKFKVSSLRVKTWLYFLFFSAIILFTIWVLQVFLLETTYLDHRKNSFQNIGKTLGQMTESDLEQINTYINETSLANNMNIMITDIDGFVLLPSEIANQPNNQLSAERLNMLITRLSNKDEAMYKQHIDGSAVLIYASKVKLNQNGAYIYLSAPLEPVAQTAKLLKDQLLYIMILVVFVSFVLSYFFSKNLSQPVLQMSKRARRLAKRDFSATFTGSPYREINELAQTLNYAKNELMQAD